MADTTVDANVYTGLGSGDRLWGPYWIDTQIGYVVFMDAESDISYARTDDGGATWATTEIQAGTVFTVAVWYERETPGDAGTLLHIAWGDGTANDALYVSLDLSDETLGTIRTVDGTPAFGSSQDRIAITKLVNGRIICCFVDTTGGNFAFKSAETTAPYFASAPTSIAAFYEAAEGQNDWGLLFPADVDDGDCAGIHWERTGGDIEVFMYDDSLDTWTVTQFEGSASMDSTFRDVNGAIRHSDNHLLLVYHSAADGSGNDLRTVDITVDRIASVPFTDKTDIFTDVAEQQLCGILIDQQSDDVYVAWQKGDPSVTTTSVIVYVISTDGMANWGSEQVYSEGAPDDIRALAAGRTVGDDGGRFQPVWFNDDNNDLLVNLVNDIEIAAVAAPAPTAVVQIAGALGGNVIVGPGRAVGY